MPRCSEQERERAPAGQASAPPPAFPTCPRNDIACAEDSDDSGGEHDADESAGLQLSEEAVLLLMA